MEYSQNTSSKGQRNQKKQRDKKKTAQETVKKESPNTSKFVKDDKGNDPQPQRANRRQRSEPINKKDDEPAPAPTPAVIHEKKETLENVVVDHSNLKRETEEIAKLKTKFTKREITSNWHRYTAPEGSSDSVEPAEDAPANFFDLLQVPVSKGGHLQLKDEQDWSAASGTELGSYFALDLKLLTQSLACIPLCDQLRLPKHCFTEEEIRRFDATAERAKTFYNPNEVEDPNVINYKKPFNILDIGQSNKILLNIGINELETPNINHNEGSLTNLIETVDFKPRQESKVIETKNDTLLNSIEVTNSDETFKKEDLDIEKENLTIPVVQEKENLTIPVVQDNNPEIQVSQIMHSNNSKENFQDFNEKHFEETIQSNKGEKDTFVSECTDPVEQNKVKLDELNGNKIDYTESKEKRLRRNNRKSPVVEVNRNKTEDRVKDIRLDEDDDLDFLLSLKTPVLSKANEELKHIPSKDSSFLPEGPVLTQPTTQDQHSELDDWLDSVLED